MSDVCASRNLKITGSTLGIEKWSVPRIVTSAVATPLANGAIGATIFLPGKLMQDQTLSWTSDYPIPVMVRLMVNRGGRTVITSNPNAVQIRDRWTWKIDGTPTVPDPSVTLQSQMGTALDLSTNVAALPLAGWIRLERDTALTEEWIGPVPAGSTLNVHYKCYAWTPPPFSNNANNGGPFHEAHVRNTTLLIMTFPSQDPEIIT